MSTFMKVVINLRTLVFIKVGLHGSMLEDHCVELLKKMSTFGLSLEYDIVCVYSYVQMESVK